MKEKLRPLTSKPILDNQSDKGGLKLLQDIKENIEKEKKIIFKARNNLREYLEELEQFTILISEGYEYLHDSVNSLESAIDIFSQEV